MVGDRLTRFAHELANKFTLYFDVYRDEQPGDFPLSFIAHYKRRDERYMVMKKIKVYGVENQQLVFAAVANEPVSLEFVRRFQDVIDQHKQRFIQEDAEHMSTIVLGLIVAEGALDKAVLKEVRKFRKVKFLKFGWHGWVETYVAILHPDQKTVHIHPKGRSFVKSIETLMREDKISL
ncbi:hypothetical protein M493_02065 [Geobacillus genomosp. 3]|uniref:DUF8052 domain-containing protein n=1 Tax=Geobacillus genomosp. 3 TaxID=1921421 RepID=S5Z1B1_GEOG3|nr:hypothetical protein [Geobacillus genomosp. 3]AGT30747.1 hypothetical protein M493_02065 [Geobacillus genomosp. 3]